MKMGLQPVCRTALTLLVLLSAGSIASHAQNAIRTASEPTLSPGFRFSENTGEELFANICQGCHMPDGRGAVGAGIYPSINNDKNLEAGGYPVSVVVNGQRAMPALGAMMSDQQVVAVVNYLRTHFGNDYQDAVTVEDVKTVRP
jgi:cytochrome c5